MEVSMLIGTPLTPSKDTTMFSHRDCKTQPAPGGLHQNSGPNEVAHQPVDPARKRRSLACKFGVLAAIPLLWSQSTWAYSEASDEVVARGTAAVALAASAIAPNPEPAVGGEEEQERQKVRMYFMWGQSHMGSAGRVQDVASMNIPWASINSSSPAPYPTVSDVVIWDKAKRGRSRVDGMGLRESYLYHESLDGTGATLGCSSSRPAEAYSFRSLTAGYGGAVKADQVVLDPKATFGTYCQQYDWYPWETQTQMAVSNPAFGVEMSFATELRGKTDDIIVISKLAIGGSSVLWKDNIPELNWNHASTYPGGYGGSYYETFADYYIDAAIGTALLDYPEADYELSIGGVISLIGSNDALRPPAPYLANPTGLDVEHYDAYRSTIIALRDRIASATAMTTASANIPYLLLQTPKAMNLPVPGYYTRLQLIQPAQDSLDSSVPTTGLANVDVLPTTNTLMLDFATGAHADAFGTLALGELMGGWANNHAPIPVN